MRVAIQDLRDSKVLDQCVRRIVSDPGAQHVMLRFGALVRRIGETSP